MKMLTLKGQITHPVRNSENYLLNKGQFVQYFTSQEKDLAMKVAEDWDKRGWQPVLFLQGLDNVSRTLYNYRTRARRRAA